MAEETEAAVETTKTSITTTPPADRPLYKRMTAQGVAVLAIIQILEDQHMIPMGLTNTLAEFGQLAGGLLVSLGLYRHIPTT